MKVQGSRRTFGTPVEVGTATTKEGNNPGNSVDEQTDAYLSDRRKRKLEGAKQAELEHVTEEELTEAARQRKTRELIEGGTVSPMGNKEGDMATTDKKVKGAAEVAAEAAKAGVTVEEATALGTGERPVVVIQPEDKRETPTEGGWSVLEGKPVKDPEGEYTFLQALKVAQLEHPPVSTSDNKKTLAEELADAKLKLEALGIKVGTPPPASPRSLKEEVAEAMALLESLGLKVGTNEQAPLKEQVAEAKSLLEGLGLSIGIPGASLDHIKETHRHEERKDEISADREYKKNITEVAAGTFERIGHGIGDQILGAEEGGGGAESSGGSGLEYMICEDENCKTRIFYTPETSQITCPKCGAIYGRPTAETKTHEHKGKKKN